MSSLRSALVFTSYLLLRVCILSPIAAALLYPVRLAHGVTTKEQALGAVRWTTIVVICIALVAWLVAGANRRTRALWKSAIYSGLLMAFYVSCVCVLCPRV
jgi:hypothetical protein